MIQVSCECGESFRADERHLGYLIKCGTCHSIVPITKSSSPQLSAPNEAVVEGHPEEFHLTTHKASWYHTIKGLILRFLTASKKRSDQPTRFTTLDLGIPSRKPQKSPEKSAAPVAPLHTSTPTSIKGDLTLNEPSRGNLKKQIEDLAIQVWGSQESWVEPLLLDPLTLSIDIGTAIESILSHVRKIAPDLTIPYRVPRIEIASLIDAGGQFIVIDGWVSIKIAEHLVMDRKAIRAVLAHEICHYVLENSGIREKDVDQNERLTDLSMFLFGLGQLFIDGYKSESVQREYRPGHRLGYLSDAEYKFATEYVHELRSSNSLIFPTRLKKVKQRLANAIPDRQTRERLIGHARKRYPEIEELELYEIVLEEFERDRR